MFLITAVLVNAERHTEHQKTIDNEQYKNTRDTNKKDWIIQMFEKQW